METNNNHILKSYIQHPFFTGYRDGYVVFQLCVDAPSGIIVDITVSHGGVALVQGNTFALPLLLFQPLRAMMDLVCKSLYTPTLGWNPDEMITSASLRSAVYTPGGIAFSRRDPAKFLTPRIELELRDDCADPKSPTRDDILLDLYLDAQARNFPSLRMPASLVPDVLTTLMDVADIIDEYESLSEDQKIALSQREE